MCSLQLWEAVAAIGSGIGTSVFTPYGHIGAVRRHAGHREIGVKLMKGASVEFIDDKECFCPYR
jgi:hypothetical protein